MASDRERPPHRSSCASSALGNQTDDDEPEPRHRLAPQSISRGMTVALYSKNKKIKEGMLAKWKQGIEDKN
ncbi:hypothetical protein KEM48_011672 [Puccinia striiformis f. sp. tritici PST-130]|nr:hypothetical protein KEM48_011672 [Puccinia striiformis f. sp. tritici PST-130]